MAIAMATGLVSEGGCAPVCIVSVLIVVAAGPHSSLWWPPGLAWLLIYRTEGYKRLRKNTERINKACACGTAVVRWLWVVCVAHPADTKYFATQ